MFNFPFLAAIKAEMIAIRDAAVEARDAVSQLVDLAINGPASP